MNLSWTVADLKAALEKLDDSYDNYEVLFWDQGDNIKHFIKQIKIRKRDKEVCLTNSNKYASQEQ